MKLLKICIIICLLSLNYTLKANVILYQGLYDGWSFHVELIPSDELNLVLNNYEKQLFLCNLSSNSDASERLSFGASYALLYITRSGNTINHYFTIDANQSLLSLDLANDNKYPISISIRCQLIPMQSVTSILPPPHLKDERCKDLVCK